MPLLPPVESHRAWGVRRGGMRFTSEVWRRRSWRWGVDGKFAQRDDQRRRGIINGLGPPLAQEQRAEGVADFVLVAVHELIQAYSVDTRQAWNL